MEPPIPPHSTVPRYAPSDSEMHFSLREALTILFRQKWKILMVLIGVVGTAYHAVNDMDNIYESTAKLLIQVGRENMATDPTVVGPTMYVEQKMENKLNTEVAILKNSEMIKRVVEKVGPGVIHGETPTPVDWTKIAPEDVEGMKDYIRYAAFIIGINLNVTVEKDTYIIALSLTLPHRPDVTQEVLHVIIEEFEVEHLNKHQTQASPDTFATIIDEVKMELTKHEQALEHFRRTHHIANLQQQQSALAARLSELENRMEESRYQIVMSKAKIQSLKGLLAKEPKQIVLNISTGSLNPIATRLKEKLTELRLRERELGNRYQQDSRMLQDLRRQITTTEKLLQEEPATITQQVLGTNSNWQTLHMNLLQEQAQLEAEETSLATLAKKLTEHREKVSQFANLEIEEDRLLRALQAKKLELEEFQQSERRSLFASKMDAHKVSSVQLLENPSFNDEPVEPDRKMFMVLAVFLGVFGGIAFAFLADFLDDSVRAAKDVSRFLKLPVLATIRNRDYKKCLKS